RTCSAYWPPASVATVARVLRQRSATPTTGPGSSGDRTKRTVRSGTAPPPRTCPTAISRVLSPAVTTPRSRRGPRTVRSSMGQKVAGPTDRSHRPRPPKRGGRRPSSGGRSAPDPSGRAADAEVVEQGQLDAVELGRDGPVRDSAALRW